MQRVQPAFSLHSSVACASVIPRPSLTSHLPSPAPPPPLTCLPGRNTAAVAYGKVDVPEAVIDLLTSTRNYLQARGGLSGNAGKGQPDACCL